MNQIMPHWLTKQAELSPNKIAIETDETSLTFSQLQEHSERFARKIASLTITPQAKVAILSTNQLEMIIAIHALTYLQTPMVMLNTRLSNRELTYQIKQAEVELIITTDELRNEKELEHPNQKTYGEINLLSEINVELAKQIDLSKPCTLMFTSGTTGLPKTVVHTYGNHWWSAVGSMLNLGLTDEDKWLLTLPMFHIGGFSILMKNIIYGMPIYLMGKYNANYLYEVLNEKKITIASLVSLMLRQLIDELGENELPSYIRCILLGGGSVPDPLLKKIEEKKMPLFQSYGMTETSSQIVTISLADAKVKSGSSGKALFPADLRIENPNMDGIGEIWVKGPMVMNGYLNNKKANEESFHEDWFKSGDLGFMDKDGFLYVVDRRSDLIISGGENIYPSEIENVILELDGIVEAAVVGKKDDVWGEIPVAFVVENEKKTSADKILNHLKNNLASYKVPKEIIYVDTLPKNASNKIMRHKLKEKLQP
ncbi:o-succinylbenzoate--CoA ligase [Pseudogracilibacillus sp. SO30301A]|uniref:o-succinylbenzoate--CoA ligase n=1 Tax=Pseudogracilibacillus sp. SO30301A TaxID=3098291 RepID=UPI00300E12F4